MSKINKIIITGILCMFTCMVFFGCKEKDEEVFIQELPHAEEESQSQIAEESDHPCCVYVCGYVKNDGVFELPAGSRICDAIAAAGGFLDDACQEYWNQAQLLTDGQMIYVPSASEAKDTLEKAPNDPEMDTDPDRKININTASKELLTSISGIGNGRADAIIRYRQDNGSFKTVEDIKNVSGIGDSIFENIKDYITVK